jgi:hypothetical protein
MNDYSFNDNNSFLDSNRISKSNTKEPVLNDLLNDNKEENQKIVEDAKLLVIIKIIE